MKIGGRTIRCRTHARRNWCFKRWPLVPGTLRHGRTNERTDGGTYMHTHCLVALRRSISLNILASLGDRTRAGRCNLFCFRNAEALAVVHCITPVFNIDQLFFRQKVAPYPSQ